VAVIYHFEGGGSKALGWVIFLSIDHPGPWWTGSFMENSSFIEVGLSDVRVILAIMCVLVEEFAISGGDRTNSTTRVPTAKHVGAKAQVLSCLALNGPVLQGTRLWGHLPGLGNPLCGYRQPRSVSS
jgi:hypothetical protein